MAQYGITPAELKALLEQDSRVNVFLLLIGSMGTQAQQLKEQLPADGVLVTSQLK